MLVRLTAVLVLPAPVPAEPLVTRCTFARISHAAFQRLLAILLQLSSMRRPVCMLCWSPVTQRQGLRSW